MKRVNWKSNTRFQMLIKSVVFDPSLGKECDLFRQEDSEMKKVSIADLSVGDLVISYNLEKKEREDVEVIDTVEPVRSIKTITFNISVKGKSLNLTNSHLIPYYRDDELIVDNSGTIQVGDKLIFLFDDFSISSESVDSVEEGYSDDEDVYHPKTTNGYYFINGILIHD